MLPMFTFPDQNPFGSILQFADISVARMSAIGN